MDYKEIYNNIILNAKSRNLTEQNILLEIHHIIPRACGGNNQKNNLVSLTPKEHFICHLLLTKIYKNTEFENKMIRAAFLMRGGRVRYKSRAYQKIKEMHILNLKKQKISEEQKAAISKANKGNKSRTGQSLSSKHKEALLQSRIGWIPSEETRKIWSEQRKGRIAWNKGKKGIIRSKESIEKQKNTITGKKRENYGKQHVS